MLHSTRLYEAGDIAMVYEEFDSRSSHAPRTLVLIHGIGMGRIVFDGVAEILGAHHRILAVDLPGFGDSPEPGSAASLEETAEIVA